MVLNDFTAEEWIWVCLKMVYQQTPATISTGNMVMSHWTLGYGRHVNHLIHHLIHHNYEPPKSHLRHI